MKRTIPARAFLPCCALLLGLAVSPVQAQPSGDPAGTSAPRAKTGVHYLYLVRHGVYDPDPNAPNDSVGNGLNALGHEQAKLVGARLAAMPVKFNRLVSSGFLRAVQTADDMGVLMKMKPARDAVLNECTPTSSDPRVMAGDSPADVALCDSMRAIQWQRYFTPTPERDTYDVLVCHGNIIRWTFLRACGADTKAWANLRIWHASLTIIAVRPDGSVRPMAYSDVGHIPPAKQTPK